MSCTFNIISTDRGLLFGLKHPDSCRLLTELTPETETLCASVGAVNYLVYDSSFDLDAVRRISGFNATVIILPDRSIPKGLAPSCPLAVGDPRRILNMLFSTEEEGVIGVDLADLMATASGCVLIPAEVSDYPSEITEMLKKHSEYVSSRYPEHSVFARIALPLNCGIELYADCMDTLRPYCKWDCIGCGVIEKEEDLVSVSMLLCIPKKDYNVHLCGENAIWELDGETGVLTVRGSGPLYDCFTVGLHPIFHIRDRIRRVIIEEGVTSVGMRFFQGCDSLTTVDLPDSMTKLGESCFDTCVRLAEIHLPAGVTHIGVRAFHICRALERIRLPESVKNIGAHAFELCGALQEITVTEGVTEIEDNCFDRCGSLVSVTLPSSITAIGEKAFADCYSLENLRLPDGIVSIADDAFVGCESLTVETASHSYGAAFAEKKGINVHKI